MVGEKFKISRCTELSFFPPITVLSLPPPKLPLSPRKGCDKFIPQSGDVEDDDSRRGAGRTAIAVDDNLPISLLNFLTVIFPFSRISWQ